VTISSLLLDLRISPRFTSSAVRLLNMSSKQYVRPRGYDRGLMLGHVVDPHSS
jgi:hypothetical protein